MEEDGERVNKLFEKAPQVGIQVQVTFLIHDLTKSFLYLFQLVSFSSLLFGYGTVEVNNWRRAFASDIVRPISGHSVG